MAQNLRENMLDLTDDEDFVEAVEVLRNARRQPQKYRERPDHFLIWTEEEFVQRFRLSKQGVRYVINQIEAQITSQTEKNHAVTADQMVLVTLRFYATGSFLQATGDFAGIDKSTASRIIWKVSRAIAGLYNQFIRMPQTQDEMRNSSKKFYNIARFPKCIGAIDCTHIKILSPGGNNAEDVVCRWPGSTHDSQIFANSTMRAKFERGDFQDNLLVGDSGYAIKSYLMTPLTDPRTRQEELFNESQIRTRNCIERKFGQWKRRFPILAFGIRLKVEKVEAIVIATAVLDNIAKLLNEQDPPNNEEEEAALNLIDDVNAQPYMNIHNLPNVNNIVRHQLINYYFNQL